MFFPERITGIKPTDRVLDIGPGAHPHARADVLLEMTFSDPEEYKNQFGHDQPLVTDKEVVYYDGITFPFADQAFDYVICTHVLEHVPNVAQFLSEVFRVGKRGYFEYPLAYYDLLYNINAHVNFVKRTDGALRYMKKSDTALNQFLPLQQQLLQSLDKGHTQLVDELKDLFMEGFEWDAPFPHEQVHAVAAVCHAEAPIPERRAMRPDGLSTGALLRALLTKTKRRIGLG